jgi:hypothetical protein
VLPDNEPLRDLEAADVLVLGAAVREGVNSCRQALTAWLDTSETGPVEDAVAQAATRLLRSVAAADARPPGPATTLLVRLLLVAVIEEMGRAQVVTLN